MRLLVLGGTAWLGGRVVEAALAEGDEVTCVARGVSGSVPEGARLVVADRGQPDALRSAPGEYDAVVDVSRQPGQVRDAMTDLAPRCAHAVLVSTGNVYAEHGLPAGDEDSALLDPLAAEEMTSMEDYGSAKVACEQAVVAAFGPARSTVVRAGLIGGPGDGSGRTAYWPWRFAHPATPDGSVLVPRAPLLAAAVIDVRDLAAWIVRMARAGTAGPFDAAGEPMPLADHLRIAREVAGHRGEVVEADGGWLAEQGVQPWMGPDSLPLWLDDEDWLGFTARTSARAVAAGLERRPLEQTLGDLLAGTTSAPEAAGLGDERERELITAWRARREPETGQE